MKLLDWYLRYFDLSDSNRKFVVFFRNKMYWPEKSFVDNEAWAIQLRQNQIERGYTDVLLCRIEKGFVSIV